MYLTFDAQSHNEYGETDVSAYRIRNDIPSNGKCVDNRKHEQR